MGLTACGSTNESEISVGPEINAEIPSSSADVGLIPIQSDNVQAAGYDTYSLTMTVQFNNGYTYEYYGVSAELWNSFIAAQPDPWSLVGYPRLVQAAVPYKRIR